MCAAWRAGHAIIWGASRVRGCHPGPDGVMRAWGMARKYFYVFGGGIYEGLLGWVVDIPSPSIGWWDRVLGLT